MRFVSGLLQTTGEQELHKISHVQTRRRRVETHVELDRPLVHVGPEGFQVSRVGNQPTPAEVVEQCVHEGSLLTRSRGFIPPP